MVGARSVEARGFDRSGRSLQASSTMTRAFPVIVEWGSKSDGGGGIGTSPFQTASYAPHLAPHEAVRLPGGSTILSIREALDLSPNILRALRELVAIEDSAP